MSSYRDYLSKLAPPWLRGPNGSTVLQELGGELDVQVDRGRQGVLANFPDQCPADALDLVGADRLLPRAMPGGVPEADVAYRERLRTAWDGVDGWSYAGSHGSLLRALARAGFPTGLAAGAVIIQRTKRYSYLVAGVPTFGVHTGWTFDTTPPRYWNQFGIFFGADVAGLADGTPLAAQLNAVVRLWKPAKALFMGTRIFLTGPWWDYPFGVAWDDVGRLWGDGVTTGTSRFVAP